MKLRMKKEQPMEETAVQLVKMTSLEKMIAKARKVNLEAIKTMRELHWK